MAAINVILKIPIDRICNNRSKNIYNKNFTFSDDSNTDDVVQNYEKCIIYFIFYYRSEWIILSILSVHESTLLLTFLSIVRGMQIFDAKSRLQQLSNAINKLSSISCQECTTYSLVAESPAVARGYSRSTSPHARHSRRYAMQCNRYTGRTVPYRETFDRVLLSRKYQAASAADPIRQRRSKLVRAIGI